MPRIWISCPHCKVHFQVEDPQISCICQACGVVVPAEPGWFYVHQRQKVGPVSWQRLKQLVATGELRPADMILQQGAGKWTPVSSLQDLFAFASTVKNLAELQSPADADMTQALPGAIARVAQDATLYEADPNRSEQRPAAEAALAETIGPPPANAPQAVALDGATEWFYSHNRQKLGPVSWEQLRALAAAGQLQPTDMVIQKGAAKWGPASALAGLFAPTATVNNTVAGTIDPKVGEEQLTVPLPGVQPLSQPPLSATIQETVNAKNAAGGEFASTLMHAVKPALPVDASLPAVTGYAILGVLGRGGMGVVYKAKQLSLKRLVALKMVLSAEHAGPEQLARFRSEAEAVAQLQHPNIVQIYEVGQQDGRPYFSLEFVDGGSLSGRLAEKPLEPMDSARLIETLARAMHYCHQRGIVHRDLKPANVLLTSDGLPKITDFGLAKQLETDSGQTHSGAVMGTPSYMSPEQAAGRTKQIGPLSDVYALGAILYELLAGRPPFRGNSLVETLEQVRSQDATPPTKLSSKVPRDLETICLKALAKEPARRYSSALALCQDLERFQAGEAILARREGMAARIYRKVRRSPVTAASLLLVFLAVVAVAHFAFRASTSTRLVELNRSFAIKLQTLEATAESLNDLEKLLTQIDRLSPEQGASARERLHQRFAESIHASMQNTPVLHDDDVTRIGAALDLLASRDSAQAKTLRKEFADRCGRQQRTLDLKDADRGSAAFVVVNTPDALVLTTARCQGTVQLEAEFASWESAPQVGLVLNARNRAGYTFKLSAGDDEAAPQTFAGARKKGGPLHMQILRNGVRLREQDLKAAEVPAGVLRLSAKRVADRLVFQVNDSKPMEFQDLFPLSGDPGVFGLLWPEGVRVQRLQGSAQVLPAAPSPLERGDDFYAAGKLREALREYQAQAATASAPEIRQEARYKEALCLLGLKSEREATDLFREIAAEGVGEANTRWPILADCQLWLLLLRQNRFAEADALIDKLTVAHGLRFEQLAVLLPEDLRWQILGRYEAGGTHFFIRPPEEIVRNFERALRVRKILEGTSQRFSWAQWGLVKAYHLAGQDQKALQTAEEMFKLVGYEHISGENYVWILRSRREFDRALTEVNRWLTQARAQGDGNKVYYLLLERARIHIGMQRFDQAEADINEILQVQADKQSATYHQYSSACLLQGFLRERRGDTAGATEAWKRGLLKYWKPSSTERDANVLGPSSSAVHNLIMASLSDDFTDADIEKNLAWINTMTSGESSYSKLLSMGMPQPSEMRAILQDMWRHPRGREWARRLAYRDCTFAEYIRMPGFLLVAEYLHKQAFPAPLSREQDEVVWKFVTDGYAAFLAGKIPQTQILTLAFTWKGTPNLPGFNWQTQAKAVDPLLRGPLSYIIGRRYVDVLKKPPEDALPFFQTALADAPANSELRRLAQADLDRIKK